MGTGEKISLGFSILNIFLLLSNSEKYYFSLYFPSFVFHHLYYPPTKYSVKKKLKMLFSRNWFLNPTMWEQVETSKVISYRYKFVSRIHEAHVLFFCLFFDRREVHVRKVMKMPIQSPNSQMHMLRWSFTVPTDNIGAVEGRKVWSFSYV